jgi:uncharacterized protein YjiS (DUF1127 family)
MNTAMTKATGVFFPEPRSASSTGRMLILARAAQALSAWSRRRRAAAELKALTDRELADLGLTRGDIGNVVRGAH